MHAQHSTPRPWAGIRRLLEMILQPLELMGELERRLRCIKWEQDCRFLGRNCIRYKLTCSDTKPLGQLLQELRDSVRELLR